MEGTPDQIYDVLKSVADPCAIEHLTQETSVVALGVIADVRCEDGTAVIRVAPTTGLCPHTAVMVSTVKQAVLDSGLVEDVTVELALGAMPVRRTNTNPNEKS